MGIAATGGAATLHGGPGASGLVVSIGAGGAGVLVDGIGDSAVKTGQDFAHLDDSLWHGSIF